MIHVGIDIGHGETSVSRTPGSNNGKTSRIALTRGSHLDNQKIVSAICRDNGEAWRFVLNGRDYSSDEIREGFKGNIEKKDTDKEALGEFVKLVFNTILDNDYELSYDPQTGESNFDICIACPSDWRSQDSSIPEKYLRFFREQCGITPIKMCINESDAAFYSKYNEYALNETVLVIDLGSSTVDYTTYNGTRFIKDLCWGDNLGAHVIEDKLIDKGFDKNRNVKWMDLVDERRKKNGQCSARKALSLIVRKAKEDYFTNNQYKDKLPFIAEVLVSFLDRSWDGQASEKAFTIELDYQEFDRVLSDYKNQLKTNIEFAAKKICGRGVNPTRILLSGGASRMDFVKEYAQNAFPNAKIVLDNTPEWVVSDGASKYIETWYMAQHDVDELKREFRSWAETNLVPIVKEEALNSFKEALSLELKRRLEKHYLKNTDDGTNLYAFKKIAVEAITNATKTPDFKNNADKRFIASINGQIVNKMQEIIYKTFKKSVDIDDVFVDPGNFFGGFTASYETINEKIEDIIHDLFDNYFETVFGGSINWVKERDYQDREKIIDKSCKDLPQGYYVEFDESIINVWIDEACNSIQSILEKNGLFDMSM